MIPLCQGIEPILSQIQYPPAAMVGERVSFRFVVEHGLNPFFPRKYQVRERDGSSAVPETANLDFEKKCQLFHAYNHIALRTQHLIKAIRPLPSGDWRGPFGRARLLRDPLPPTNTSYVFLPEYVIFRVPSLRGCHGDPLGYPIELWTHEPCLALASASEVIRGLIGFYQGRYKPTASLIGFNGEPPKSQDEA